jgi:tetratricopeptide (TPR) repeat protein
MRASSTPATLLAALLVGAPLARAEPPAGGTTARAEGESTERQRRDRAIELFRRSEELYREGRFEDAAALLDEAYRLDPAPTLLYNRARALESAGNLEGAAAAYRHYLATEPKARDRAAIERRVDNLDRQLAERRALEVLARERNQEAERRVQEAERRALEAAQRPPPVERPAPPAVVAPLPAPAARGSVAPWVIGGAGVGAAIAGGVLGMLASQKSDAAAGASSQAETVRLDDGARGLALGANVAYAAGGALALTGLLWLLLGDDEAPRTGASLVPAAAPGGLALGGRF